ncbi:hypothetical protein HMPREF9446_03383 [Bacteroides fluxus YIT 12057]|uniref:Uncharacterized protein n=1 Tax=Bacteroides fluxus YIT 12057 TaxID=763034 RepID=F3PX93_9BACE|nr:hypothetical protein HMPREF9446_03383 [Bacteroides fluxus YIT 12057]
MQAETDIAAVILHISGKDRTVTGFQAPCRVAAIKGTGITVLPVDADKILAIRQILQRTGFTSLMVIVRCGLNQVTRLLR